VQGEITRKAVDRSWATKWDEPGSSGTPSAQDLGRAACTVPRFCFSHVYCFCPLVTSSSVDKTSIPNLSNGWRCALVSWYVCSCVHWGGGCRERGEEATEKVSKSPSGFPLHT